MEKNEKTNTSKTNNNESLPLNNRHRVPGGSKYERNRQNKYNYECSKYLSIGL